MKSDSTCCNAPVVCGSSKLRYLTYALLSDIWTKKKNSGEHFLMKLLMLVQYVHNNFYVALCISKKEIYFVSSNYILFSNFPFFSWNHLQRCHCIRRNNVNSFPCCRVTLFNPHYSKHLSFAGPPSHLIPLPPSAVLQSFFPPSIYSISTLRRCKFIMVAANGGETQSVHFQDNYWVAPLAPLSCFTLSLPYVICNNAV